MKSRNRSLFIETECPFCTETLKAVELTNCFLEPSDRFNVINVEDKQPQNSILNEAQEVIDLDVENKSTPTLIDGGSSRVGTEFFYGDLGFLDGVLENEFDE